MSKNCTVENFVSFGYTLSKKRIVVNTNDQQMTNLRKERLMDIILRGWKIEDKSEHAENLSNMNSLNNLRDGVYS